VLEKVGWWMSEVVDSRTDIFCRSPLVTGRWIWRIERVGIVKGGRCVEAGICLEFTLVF
jgi:hypothetical protein